MTYSRWCRSNIVLGLLGLGACTSSYTSEEKALRAVLNTLTQQGVDEQVRVYVVVPGAGCAGCISTAEQFMFDNISRLDKVCFILTQIGSKKLYRQKLGAILQHPRVLSDYKNIVAAQGLHSLYPRLYYMDKGHITRVVEASPNTKADVWKDILKYLANEK